MELYRGTKIPQILNPVVVTIGNFDGIHLGHELILDVLLRQANLRKASSLILSFYPLTKRVSVLMSFREKLDYLSRFGINYLWVLPFFKIRKLSCEQFLSFLDRYLLIDRYILGEDFQFGYQRKGTIKDLNKKVILVPDYKIASERISSSLIRNTKSLVKINKYLGRNYSIICRIISKIRCFGFLIINMVNKFMPFEGFFLVKVIIEHKEILGKAKVTFFCSEKFSIELRIFNFKGRILDKFLKIVFLREIEQKKYFNYSMLMHN